MQVLVEQDQVEDEAERKPSVKEVGSKHKLVADYKVSTDANEIGELENYSAG